MPEMKSIIKTVMYTHNRHRFNLLVNVTPQGSQLVWFLLLSRANTRLTQGPIDGNAHCRSHLRYLALVSLAALQKAGLRDTGKEESVLNRKRQERQWRQRCVRTLS